MCPKSLKALEDCKKRSITPKAIIVVHLYGMPKMDEILEVHFFNVPVVEDAAEALGSKINGVPCGSFGRLSILSFNGNKIITTSEEEPLSNNDRDITEANFYLHRLKKIDLFMSIKVWGTIISFQISYHLLV